MHSNVYSLWISGPAFGVVAIEAAVIPDSTLLPRALRSEPVAIFL